MKDINETVGEIVSDDGCKKLLEAVFWQAIKDYIFGLAYASKHAESKCDTDYITAVNFLQSFERGRRAKKIIDGLPDEKLTELLSKRNEYN